MTRQITWAHFRAMSTVHPKELTRRPSARRPSAPLRRTPSDSRMAEFFRCQDPRKEGGGGGSNSRAHLQVPWPSVPPARCWFCPHGHGGLRQRAIPLAFKTPHISWGDAGDLLCGPGSTPGPRQPQGRQWLSLKARPQGLGEDSSLPAGSDIVCQGQGS